MEIAIMLDKVVWVLVKLEAITVSVPQYSFRPIVVCVHTKGAGWLQNYSREIVCDRPGKFGDEHKVNRLA